MRRSAADETLTLALCEQRVEIRFPSSLAADVRRMFPASMLATASAMKLVTVYEQGEGYSLHGDDIIPAVDLSRFEILPSLMEEVTRALITELDTGVALHAGAVGCRDTSILMPGVTGQGKSSMTAWLVANGFDYLSDEVAVLKSGGTILGLPRALVIKPGAAEYVKALSDFDESKSLKCGPYLLTLPNAARIGVGARTVGLIIIPNYEPAAEAKIEALPPGEVALRLVASNLNARNLKSGGLDLIAALSRQAPAILFRFGGFDQLKGTLDAIIDLTIRNHFSVFDMKRFVSALTDVTSRSIPSKRYPIPTRTPQKRAKTKLTVGMTTYDDYDGVYFTLQAMRLYHPEVLGDVEFLVIDNNPAGPCSEPLKRLENSIPNYRYVPEHTRYGTAVRDQLFKEATTKFVLCIDCHVLLVPGALVRLIRYFDSHGKTSDLLQGPLVRDNLTIDSTHFHPEWRQGMFGYWAFDERGRDPDAEPFEIPMQGLGLFACRKAAWPGLNPAFRGFGGEEGYIHEKFRQSGGKTLCLPFLRWVHRFDRPMGLPYPNSWEDRIRNYAIGWQELGLPTDQMKSHFASLLGAEAAEQIFARLERYKSTSLPKGRLRATSSQPPVRRPGAARRARRGSSPRASR
jgi:hypothetical protein